MKKLGKKLSLFFFLITAVLISLAALAWAADLETDYINLPGVTEPDTVNTPLNIYIRYIYNLSIFLAAALAFVLLVWGGLGYIINSHNPGRLTEDRERVKYAFVGLSIVLGSYMIVNTVSPDLTLLPSGKLPLIPNVFVPNVEVPQTSSHHFLEIPLGIMITAEIGPSAYITTSTASVATTTDPDTKGANYAASSSDVLSYPTQYQETLDATTTHYQGALEGRRLKRIHEVASTTILVAGFLRELYGDLLSATDELGEKIDKLNSLSQDCGCQNCGDRNGCTGNGVCLCDCLCEGDFCLDEDKMNQLLDEIPDYYQEPDSLLKCKLAHVEYYSRAFEAFLRDDGYLVKSDEDDYQDNSYWYSERADELRGQIEDCISNGMIEQEQYDDDDADNDNWSTEELIVLMARVENKGTHSPRSDPQERDVETNINDLAKQINYLEIIKNQLNPQYNPQPLTRGQYFNLRETYEEIQKNVNFVTTCYLPENLRVTEDPATFYLTKIMVSQAEPQNIAHAQEAVTCARIVEIPIGKATDEAIKLAKDILRELKNIFQQGIEMHNRTIKTTDEEEGLAVEMFEKIGSFLSSIKRLMSYNCSDVCYSECNTFPHTDAEGNVHCNCFCAPCQSNDSLVNLKKKINQVYADIKSLQGQIRSYYYFMQSAEQSIYDSFYKLHGKYPEKDPLHPSGHPKAGERTPIGKDICCTEDDANCRNEEGNLKIASLEDVDYTIIEKLIEVQKLLNRSRSFEDFKYLIEQLGPLLADEEEIDNAFKEETLSHTAIGGKYSLANCRMTTADMVGSMSGEVAPQMLENCKVAFIYGQVHREECNYYDPPFDCTYFDSRVEEKRTPLNCYCYNEVWYEDHLNVASNFFCCVEPEAQKED